MRALLFASAVASALLTAAAAQAGTETFDITWSGAALGNAATATGKITLDTSVLPTSSQVVLTLPDTTVTALSVDVSGASNGNGHFGLSDFGAVLFWSPAPLDLTQELVGQPLGGLCTYGPSSPCSDGSNGDFNLFNNDVVGTGVIVNPSAPDGTSYFRLSTNGGVGDTMLVTSIRLDTGGGVPEPASWALMIGGFGMAGAVLRRRSTAAIAA
jgi:PEP-CTERM motif